MVEGARLESVYTREGIEGSNPFLSALSSPNPLLNRVLGFFVFKRGYFEG